VLQNRHHLVLTTHRRASRQSYQQLKNHHIQACLVIRHGQPRRTNQGFPSLETLPELVLSCGPYMFFERFSDSMGRGGLCTQTMTTASSCLGGEHPADIPRAQGVVKTAASLIIRLRAELWSDGGALAKVLECFVPPLRELVVPLLSRDAGKKIPHPRLRMPLCLAALRSAKNCGMIRK
jgi:hypothetical protein